MTDLITIAVRCVDPSDLSAFGIRVTSFDAEPRFRVSDGIVWKSACWVCVYDNGRMFVQPYSHLTPKELRIVYGLAEEAFKGGRNKCRAEKWERCRQSKSRGVAYYRMHYYVRADHTEPYARIVMAAAGLTDDRIEKLEALGIDREVAA